MVLWIVVASRKDLEQTPQTAQFELSLFCLHIQYFLYFRYVMCWYKLKSHLRCMCTHPCFPPFYQRETTLLFAFMDDKALLNGVYS